MTDYWKSQGRKFCDFCKCWIADNKPSIEFHESGKKHKENVEKRLKEIHKNSAKQMKQTKKFENDIKNMENAAMAAYLKDLKGNQIDLTAQQAIQNKHKIQDQGESIDINPNRMPNSAPETNPRHKSSKFLPSNIDFCDPTSFHRIHTRETRFESTPSNSLENPAQVKLQSKVEKKKNKKKPDENLSKNLIQKLWYEALSPEGWTYYWHVETNETTWEIPADGFMSIAEQKEDAKEQALQEELLEQCETKEELKEKADMIEEQRANAEREKLKEFKLKKNRDVKNQVDGVINEIADEENKNIPYRRDYSVPDRIDPYGPWQTIEIKPKKVIDLQLPNKKEDISVKPKETVRSLPIRTFAEKKLTQICNRDSDGSSITFKKRKLGNKNVRKRLDDD